LVLFSDIPALGARASELLMPVEIILIPYLLYVFRQKQIALVLILSIAFIFLSLNLFYSSLVTPYFS
jgi:hypothetical protein